jgi:hypothetical protein
VLDSPATAWTDLPEYVFEAVVEHIQGDRAVSAIFRRVCHMRWQEAHDRLVAVLEPNGTRPQDNAHMELVWRREDTALICIIGV